MIPLKTTSTEAKLNSITIYFSKILSHRPNQRFGNANNLFSIQTQSIIAKEREINLTIDVQMQDRNHARYIGQRGTILKLVMIQIKRVGRHDPSMGNNTRN